MHKKECTQELFISEHLNSQSTGRNTVLSADAAAFSSSRKVSEEDQQKQRISLPHVYSVFFFLAPSYI